MSVPAVSVILPTHNRAELLEVSAGSVLAQTYENLELVVVDDGSTQDIQAAVQSLNDPRTRYVRRRDQGGPAAARNDGLRVARGRYVAFQDSDDQWLLDKLSLQMESLAGAGDDVMCLCGLLRRLGNRMRPYAPAEPASDGEIRFADVTAQPITYTQTWLVPRDALLAAGGFDEHLRVWEDWELLLRLAQRLRLRALAAPLVLSEQAVDSVTHDGAAFYEAMLRILSKHGESLAQRRRQRASLYYVLARLSVNVGRLDEARQALFRAIGDDPWRARPWALLAASMLGQEFVGRRLRAAAVRATEAGR